MKLSEVKTLLSGAEVKDCTCTIAGIKFVKFLEEDETAVLVAKDCVFESQFGKNNNFAKSDILRKLKEKILSKLEAEVGAENIKEFEMDLTSLDGLDTYGKITTKIGIPTFDFYRANVRLFDKINPNEWWWLANPETTPEHRNDYWPFCVSPDGGINGSGFNSTGGVRPFLHFVSSISVSCEE